MNASAVERQTTFTTSLILLCLGKHDGKIIKKMVRAGSDFLLNERSPQWSWNYWQRESNEYLTMPYPDDLDDTMCALAAIHMHRPEEIGGEALGHAVQLLTSAEKHPGGPYFTWLYRSPANEKTAWDDVDPVVNANIAFFLKHHENITLPNIISLLEKTVVKIIGKSSPKQKASLSKYYHLPVSILYFISKASPELGQTSDKIDRDTLTSYLTETEWKNPLESALALSACIHFGITGKKIDSLAAHIVNSAHHINSWKAYPFYIESIGSGKKHYSGSSALTTAFCIEALTKYLEIIKKDSEKENNKNGKKDDNMHAREIEEMKEIEAAVIEQFTRRFDALLDLQKHIKAPLEKVTAGSVGKHVTLLPYFFYNSLKKAPGKSADKPAEKTAVTNTKKLLIDLGVANLAGWVSYRIYDDILDEEGRPEMLPLANVSLRLAADIYTRYLPGKHRIHFDTLMNNLEVANTIEREQSYQKDLRISRSLPLTDYTKNGYAILADKSLPHCLGAVAILANLDKLDKKTTGRPTTKASADIAHTINFFRHYIIARQLNDDAHDWLHDLKRGFLNSASVEVIKLWKKARKQGDTSSYHVEDIERDLQSIFWYEAIVPFAKKIKSHARTAATSIRLVKSIDNTRMFDALLVPLTGAADEALSERQKMLDFLETMK